MSVDSTQHDIICEGEIYDDKEEIYIQDMEISECVTTELDLKKSYRRKG